MNCVHGSHRVYVVRAVFFSVVATVRVSVAMAAGVVLSFLQVKGLS